MKSSSHITALATLVAALVLLTPAMHAQTSLTARVNVPFSFDYGTRHFAPGVYTLNLSDSNVMVISSGRGKGIALVETAWESLQPGVNQVIFRKYGGRYFLEGIVLGDSDEHITVNESGAERRATRELAMRDSKATQVALALVPQSAPGN